MHGELTCTAGAMKIAAQDAIADPPDRFPARRLR